MQNNEFEEDYPLIVTPSRWANSNACKEVTVAPRNSQPMMGLIRMPEMSQVLKSTVKFSFLEITFMEVHACILAVLKGTVSQVTSVETDIFQFAHAQIEVFCLAVAENNMV